MSELDWIALAGQRAKGKRPDFLGDDTSERLLSIVLALTAEVSALRQRQDTLERLLEARGVLPRDAIETYVPDRAVGRERGEATSAFVHRVMRGMTQAMEAMAEKEPPVDEVSVELRDS